MENKHWNKIGQNVSTASEPDWDIAKLTSAVILVKNRMALTFWPQIIGKQLITK